MSMTRKESFERRYAKYQSTEDSSHVIYVRRDIPGRVPNMELYPSVMSTGGLGPEVITRAEALTGATAACPCGPGWDPGPGGATGSSASCGTTSRAHP